MRTFKEYYDLGMKDHLHWLSFQKNEWWKRKNMSGDLDAKGDYIETVKFLAKDEKNDSSLFENHTNVKNSEWGILFHMLGQALIDWCVENKIPENIWSFNMHIDRVVDCLDDIHRISWGIYPYDKMDGDRFKKGKEIENPERFDDCAQFLADLVDMFMTKHGYDIPNDWNYFSFGLDDLQGSIPYGEWCCCSDGYMHLGNINWELPERDRYESFVECM